MRLLNKKFARKTAAAALVLATAATLATAKEMGYERVELIDTTTGKFMPPKEAKRLMSDLLIELSCMQDWPEHYFGAVYDCEENLKSILSICKHHIPSLRFSSFLQSIRE